MSGLSSEYVRSRLSYDASTGAFTWLSVPDTGHLSRVWNSRYAGRKAGCLKKVGYWLIVIDSRGYFAHRLAWLFETGEWPGDQIDHINGNRIDNRIANLRSAARFQNGLNRGQQRNNKSGYKGVHFHRQSGRWKAQICLNGARRHIGLFSTPEQAHAAYAHAAQYLHGEFANVGLKPQPVTTPKETV